MAVFDPAEPARAEQNILKFPQRCDRAEIRFRSIGMFWNQSQLLHGHIQQGSRDGTGLACQGRHGSRHGELAPGRGDHPAFAGGQTSNMLTGSGLASEFGPVARVAWDSPTDRRLKRPGRYLLLPGTALLPVMLQSPAC
ncbi:hypothetical protein RRG08_022366 [Elysia crispata]|uniref:Uncharacterized protein n=1 Tax=Elysia crispata TaxID=231223 RepID=A0AAE0Z177_9GAST|nr:hypothetical protein RRG08_022366 [Elysia crispata]